MIGCCCLGGDVLISEKKGKANFKDDFNTLKERFFSRSKPTPEEQETMSDGFYEQNSHKFNSKYKKTDSRVKGKEKLKDDLKRLGNYAYMTFKAMPNKDKVKMVLYIIIGYHVLKAAIPALLNLLQ